MVINKYLAEFMGTFILVFIGSMGILSVGGARGAAEIIAIALAFGLGLLAAIWVVAHVSGAHFNPGSHSGDAAGRQNIAERCDRILDRSVRRRNCGLAGGACGFQPGCGCHHHHDIH